MSDAIEQLTAEDRAAVAHVENNKAGYAERMRAEANQQAGQVDAQQAEMLRNVARREVGALSDIASGDVRRLAKTVDQMIELADRTFRDAVDARTDDTLPAETREVRAQDTVTVGRAQLEQLREQALAEVEVARARLTTRALPAPSGDREGFARQDAETTLASANDPVSGLERLARDPDPNVRALAAGSWGRRRLEAAGHRNPDATHAALITQALHHTATHDSGARQAAAEAALKVSTKPVAGGVQYAYHRLAPFS